MKSLFRSTSSSNRRSIPSIRHIQAASEFLPDPLQWHEDFYDVYLEETGMELHFIKIKFTDRDRNKFARWVYEGRMVV